jgi:hypothetical protein
MTSSVPQLSRSHQECITKTKLVIAAVANLKPNITNENRPFIGRPTGDRNPSFGIQKFVSLDDMKDKEFVKHDTCFIRVDLDIEDVPKL